MYLRATNSDEGETPHSSRAGCSITLSLLGVSKESTADHVGWAHSNMVDYYSDLSGVYFKGFPSNKAPARIRYGRISLSAITPMVTLAGIPEITLTKGVRCNLLPKLRKHCVQTVYGQNLFISYTRI